jgi:hypothetical protein
MKRTWDEKSIAQFQARRDEKREKDGKPPFMTLSAQEKEETLKAEKATMLKDEYKRRTLQACHAISLDVGSYDL